MASMSSLAPLFARYPEVVASASFKKWAKHHPATIWHETAPDRQNRLSVIVQADDGSSVFAAQLDRDVSKFDQGVIRHTLVGEAEIALPATLRSAAAAAEVTRHLSGQPATIRALRPVVDFATTPPSMVWHVEVDFDDRRELFKFDTSGLSHVALLLRHSLARARQGSNGESDFEDDSLATNEIHHPGDWVAMARQWTQGANSIADKAFRVWINAKSRMRYDGTIAGINDFTYSDRMVINSFGWAGVCDEWAVVQVSFLRALGIPAVLKWLSFHYNGKDTAHACLEFLSDGGRWQHMDALWSAIERPSVYRTNGASNVKVMDVCCPRPTGTGRCDPYNDFVVSPPYPGNDRPGYAYDGISIDKVTHAAGRMMALDGSALQIVDSPFMYCSANCTNPDGSFNFGGFTPNGAIFVDKAPIGLSIGTHCDTSLLGKAVAFAVAVKDLKDDSKIWFSDSWNGTLQYADQASGLYYRATPPELAKLAAGPYRYTVSCLEIDTGAYAERTSVVFARHAPGLAMGVDGGRVRDSASLEQT